jgi:hypothetical protein
LAIFRQGEDWRKPNKVQLGLFVGTN